MIVLLYGLGSIARKHIDALEQLAPGQVEVYALRSEKNSPVYGRVRNIYHEDDLQAVPDFIIISNPTALRAEALIRALRFQVPLFIEKPAFDRMEGSSDMLRQIEEQGIKTYVACNLRFHPCIQAIREALPGMKKIDEVNIYCGSYLPEWRPGIDWRTNYSANADMGGGVHLDLIHELDYCCWLFGAPIRTQVHKTSNSHLHISAVDYANFLLAYESFTANIVLNYFRKDRKRSLEIVSEDGTWLVDLVSNEVWRGTERIAAFPDFQPADTYALQLRYFLQKLNNGEALMNSFRDSLLPLAIALS